MSTLVHPTADATAREPVPNTRGNRLAKGYVENASGAGRSYYVHFTRPFKDGATVLSATLTLHLAGAWPGTNHLTVRRVTSKWAEKTLTWNNKPSATDTHLATITITDGADGDAVTFDLTDLFQDVSGNGAYFGLHITTDVSALRSFYGMKWGKATLRPTMEYEWTLAPSAPDQLAPDGGRAITEQFPILQWTFVDNLDTASQGWSQVQMMLGDGTGNPPDFDTGPVDYDSGKQVNTQSSWDTNDGVFTGVSAGQDWWWRIKVWDASNRESDWSEPAEFTQTAFGTLTLDSPSGSTVDTVSPEIAWTLTGATQTRWRVSLIHNTGTASTMKVLYEVDGANTDSAVNIPAGYIATGQAYTVVLEVWDDVDRAFGERLLVSQDFTYQRDGTPSGPDTLVVTPHLDSLGRPTPAFDITVTRVDAPDYWSLRIDGVEVLPRIDPADAHETGDTYKIIYWGIPPREDHVVEVEAVVYDALTQKYKHSGTNPTQTVKGNAAGIWLAHVVNPGVSQGTAVMIAGNDPSGNTVAIGESGTTYDLVGAQSPVRITDSVRGYEGTIAGVLPFQADRDHLLTLKGLDDDLQLVFGDLCIPVRIEELSILPMPYPDQGTDATYQVAINFFQSDGPWPV